MHRRCLALRALRRQSVEHRASKLHFKSKFELELSSPPSPPPPPRCPSCFSTFFPTFHPAPAPCQPQSLQSCRWHLPPFQAVCFQSLDTQPSAAHLTPSICATIIAAGGSSSSSPHPFDIERALLFHRIRSNHVNVSSPPPPLSTFSASLLLTPLPSPPSGRVDRHLSSAMEILRRPNLRTQPRSLAASAVDHRSLKTVLNTAALAPPPPSPPIFTPHPRAPAACCSSSCSSSTTSSSPSLQVNCDLRWFALVNSINACPAPADNELARALRHDAGECCCRRQSHAAEMMLVAQERERSGAGARLRGGSWTMMRSKKPGRYC